MIELISLNHEILPSSFIKLAGVQEIDLIYIFSDIIIQADNMFKDNFLIERLFTFFTEMITYVILEKQRSWSNHPTGIYINICADYDYNQKWYEIY